MNAGRLVLVATPIGNLGDLSPRAVGALASAALVCCEDTRRTGRLLQHAGIHAERLAVCNEHTELSRITDVLDVLATGRDVAVVTDAGTPGVSDPGERLARAVLDAGYEVTAVPGPVAHVMALVTSGLPAARAVFDGFLPRSGSDRERRLGEIAREHRTTVLYEAPHRMERTLDDLLRVCGPDRPVAIARELTKLHEEVRRGTLGTIEIGTPRGEYVIVLGGEPVVDDVPDDDTIRRLLAEELAAGATRKDAVRSVTERTGAPKRVVYALALGTLAPGADDAEVEER